MESIREQEGVEAAEAQSLIFSEYEANGVESDSQVQMIPWTLSGSKALKPHGYLPGLKRL